MKDEQMARSLARSDRANGDWKTANKPIVSLSAADFPTLRQNSDKNKKSKKNKNNNNDDDDDDDNNDSEPVARVAENPWQKRALLSAQNSQVRENKQTKKEREIFIHFVYVFVSLSHRIHCQSSRSRCKTRQTLMSRCSTRHRAEAKADVATKSQTQRHQRHHRRHLQRHQHRHRHRHRQHRCRLQSQQQKLQSQQKLLQQQQQKLLKRPLLQSVLRSRQRYVVSIVCL